LLQACNAYETPIKFHTNDPFAKTFPASQFFEIDPSNPDIIEGIKGTVFSFPSNGFVYENGKTVTAPVKIELVEFTSIQDKLNGNIAHSNAAEAFNIASSIYWDAADTNGKAVFPKKDAPPYIEIPVTGEADNLSLYSGKRNPDGSTDWKEIEQEKYLVTLPFDVLDFYPENFKEAVKAELPIGNYEELSSILLDSIYTIFSAFIKAPNITKKLQDVYEPIDAGEKKVFIKSSYQKNDTYRQVQDAQQEHGHHGDDYIFPFDCGISPLGVKAIRTSKFENTFFATREFERRMEVIHKSCKQAIFEIYLDNLDKPMWQSDRLAAEQLKGTDLEIVFRGFEKEKCTNVKDAPKHLDKLKEFYDKKVKTYKTEITEIKKKREQEKQKASKNLANINKNYSKVLNKREQYRMKKLGCKSVKKGWIAIASNPGTWTFHKLKIKVEEFEKFDRIYTYIVYQELGSLYKLNLTSNNIFTVGRPSSPKTAMPINGAAVAIAVGYINEQAYLAKINFTTGIPLLKMKFNEVSKETFSKEIKSLQTNKKENDLANDLKIQKERYEAQKKLKRFAEDKQKIFNIFTTTFTCCRPSIGNFFFTNHCSSCHRINHKLIGPELAGVTSKHEKEWLYKFTRNSQALIKTGDERANAIYDEYSQSVMTSFPYLTNTQIDLIYEYVDSKAVMLEE